MPRALSSIASIFRAPFLEKVARDTHVDAILELADSYSQFGAPRVRQPLSRWFDFFYEILLKYYRCEYIYKNAIATKIFLSRHSLYSSFMTDEIRSAGSRADVAILNGTSTVYEIKSEYDSLDRLEDQLSDYGKVFDRICIVTTARKAESALQSIPSHVGIIVMKRDGTLSLFREPTSNKEKTDPGAVFDCMRRPEFCAAVRQAFGFVPQVPNSQLYRICREMFCRLPPTTAHDLMVSRIKRRGKKKPFSDLVQHAPPSLKHACLSFSKSVSMALDVARRLREPLT